MNKRKLAALLLGVVMTCSGVLGACNVRENDLNDGKTEQNGSQGDRDLVNDPPVRDEASGNQSQNGTVSDPEGLSPEMSGEAVQKMMDAYRVRSEEDRLAELGIGKDDYVWTIVSLKGDTVLDQYAAEGSKLSVAEYVDSVGRSLRDNMLATQKIVKDSIAASIDAEAEFSYSYTLADNGFAARVKYGDVARIRSLSQVSSVRISEQYSVPQSANLETLYSSDVNTVSANDPQAGVGSFVAILDTALDAVPDGYKDKNGNVYPGHAAFSGKSIDMSTAAVNINDIAIAYRGTVAFDWNIGYNHLTSEPDVHDVYYNNKLVFAYDYGNKDTYVLPYLVDELEHGNHTAGTAVGCDEDAGFYGVAPRAQFAFMKVFYEDTSNWLAYSNDTDIAAAIEDCIILGVDAINLSLGSPRGFSVNATSGSSYYIYEFCRYADLVGINVQAAVGNNYTGAYAGVTGDLPLANYPDYGALNAPASYESTLAVASYDGSNVDHYYGIVNENAANNFKIQVTDPADSTFMKSKLNSKGLDAGTYEIVYVEGEGNYSDFVKAGAEGKIAVVTTRKITETSALYQWIQGRQFAADQMANAIRAGAKAILYADRDYKMYRTIECNLDATIALPFGAISRLDADQLIAIGGKATVKFADNLIAHNLMSPFSAWGPSNTLNIKPEIVGVGGNVYSSLSSPGLKSNSTGYGVLSGTSMAAPQITGYSALLKSQLRSKYPGKTDRELSILVNQLLMSTATPLSDISGNIYSPRYQGAGAADFDAAAKMQAYLSVTGKTKPKMELGEDEDRTGVYFLNFNITNMSDTALKYKLSTDVMTDSLALDGKTLSLVSHLFENYDETVAVSNVANFDKANKVITVAANSTASVAITIKLTAEQKKYLNDNFKYGSYVEGFVELEGENASVVDMSIPFLAFYGDWEESALLDSTVFDKEAAYLYASRLVGTYYGGYFSALLGQYQYKVPENFSFVTEENGEYVKSDKVTTFKDIQYDANRLAIGSKTGGFDSISYIYFGLLRNADSVEIFITDVDTGVQYAYTKVDQLGRASYVESNGGMLPVSLYAGYGRSLPNNAKIKLSIRANYDNIGNTINVNDQTDFYITVDTEAPSLYRSSLGLVEQNGRTYLSIDVFDNHYLASVGIYGTTPDGVRSLLGDPLPVDTSTWKPNEINTLVYDVTDYVEGFTGTFSVLLEDSAMNAVSFAMASLSNPSNSDKDENKDDVFATKIEFNSEMNLASTYSTDLGIVTYPANAKYSLSVVPVSEMTPAEQEKYAGTAYIDEANMLVVAQKAGYVKIKITSGDIVKYADVYIYVIDGEWLYELNTGWVRHYDEETGVIDNTFYKYDPAQPNRRFYSVYAYQGEGTHVTVPSTYVDVDGESYPIVGVGYGSFRYDYSLISVTIPKSITTIVNSAFEYNTSLQKVIFEEGSDLCVLMSQAFENCWSLEEIELPGSLVQLESRAFYGCEKLKNITFTAYTKADGARLKTIQYSAFSYCPIEEFRFPETVESTGSAFTGLTTLKKVELPESLKDLGTFTGCTALEEIYIPSQIKSIPQGAFQNCISLKKVNIPNSVTQIGNSAFANCVSLTSIELPTQPNYDENGNPITFKIDANAFANCIRLINIQLPNTVTEIGNQAFVGCVSLHTLYFDRNTSINSFGTDVFTGCITFTEFIVHPANTSFMADDGILYREIPGQEGSYELYYVPVSKVITTMLIRPDVAVIRDFAFYNHRELETVLFSSAGKLYQIGNYAFANCVNLKTMNLENAKSLLSIGSYAFAGCQSLKSVVCPTSLTIISDYAFYMDVYLENIVLHDNITRIGNYAFGFCIRLKGTDGNGTLKMPARLQTLGSAAFVLNRSLYKVDMGDCSAYTGQYGEAAFESCYSLKEVILPTSLVEIPQYMFDDCTELEKINLGDTQVDTIRGNAFSNCTSLKEVTLPETLLWLYPYTFAFSGLTSIKLPDRMATATRQIWSYAFAGCTNLTDAYVPSDMYEIPIYSFAQTAIKEFTIPRGVKSTSGLSIYAFYLCSQLERFHVEEGNPCYGTTDEGMLYLLPGETSEAQLYICPPNLQAEELVLNRMFTTIPSAFFQLTSGIKKIIIPNTVKTIEAGAFYYSKIEEVEFEKDSDLDFKPYVHYSIFAGCTNLRRVVLPDHMTTVPAQMFGMCENLTDIVLPESVIAIYDDAFASCTSLTEINLENIEFLGGSAFMYCKNLKSAHLGKNLSYFCTDVNYKVFEGCEGLEEITVDKDNKILKDIDGVLFDKAGSILYVYPAAKPGSEYIIPEGVTKVDELSFGFNKYLQRVVLPATLKSVGTFAFYHTEQLDEYVFLCDVAPTLEGQYSEIYRRTLYANFYSFYSNDFAADGVYLKMYIPEGATGYDMWLYGYFFDKTYTIEDGKFTPPSQGDVAMPDDIPTAPAPSTEFGARLQKRIQELSVGASDNLKQQLQALWTRFDNESSAFWEEIEAANAFDQFEDAFIAEAESIYDSENEFFAAMWTRIHHIYNRVSELRATYKYSEDNLSLMDTMAYSAQYIIIRQSSLEGIEHYYNYYLSVIEGIPTEDGLEAFAAYLADKLEWLEQEYNSFMAKAETIYDADVIAYVVETYEDVSANISGASSTGMVDDQLNTWTHVVTNVVKKVDRAEFDKVKAEQLARFDKYKAEDYEYSLWSGVGLPSQYIGIREFIEQQRAIVEASFIIEDIIETMDYACAEINKQTSKLSSQKSKMLTLLDSYVDNYTMYTYLFDEQKITLRGIVADVAAKIENAESVEEAQEALDRGFERIWNFYEYYQKAHVEYRRAEELFAQLSAEVREQALRELKQISWRAAENWLAIRELIEQYCG